VRWGYKVLAEIRAGVDPATILDNETGKPIKPDANFSPPAPAAEPPPPPPTPPVAHPMEVEAAKDTAATASATAFQMPTILEECSDDMREMYLLWAENALRDAAPAGEAAPRDEPEPFPLG
jgi:hypothetical protein